MASPKRERQREAASARRAAEQVQTKKSRQRQSLMRILGLVAAAVILAGLFSVLNRDDSDDVASKADDSSGTTLSTLEGLTVSTVSKSLVGESVEGDTPCPKTDGSEARVAKFAKAPPMCIDPNKTYTAKIDTTEGSYTAVLDAKAAPQTVNNFVVLARYHFYDGVIFHRIVTGFMNQSGDPLGTGAGGPGYEFADELPKGDNPYKEGALAMANSGPNTNGSQFFTMAADTSLSPDYSVFGQVTSGMDVVAKINALGSPDQEGMPTKLVTITSVSITES